MQGITGIICSIRQFSGEVKYFEVPLATKIQPVEAGMGVGGVAAAVVVPIVLLLLIVPLAV